jgi:hypothetical protein
MMTRLLAGAATVAALAGCAPVAHAATPAGGCRVVDGHADARCTPGAVNPLVTQANIASTICRTGWTATIRPPVSYTSALKRQQMRAYGETGPAASYEEDHLVALELGGAPRDPRNLWPEPWEGPTGAHAKDREENALRRAVCNRRFTLKQAQAKIVADWTR